MKHLADLLNEIQQKLKAPKDRVNAFGKYKYRSCEDILEAAKPLLGESTLNLSDEIVMFSDAGIITVVHEDKAGNKKTITAPATRFYVRATATISYNGESKSVSAFAREATLKTDMDEGQITGAASSYARKYALNGLFCIDDTTDSDVPHFDEPEAKEQLKKELKPTAAQQKVLDAVIEKLIDSTPEGRVLDVGKIRAFIFSAKGKYPDDIKTVGAIAAWIVSLNKMEQLSNPKQ
jgi:hypothetical protein